MQGGDEGSRPQVLVDQDSGGPARLDQSGDLLEGSTQRRCPDIGKLAALGFSPATSLADGVAVTARWYAENAGLRPDRPKAA